MKKIFLAFAALVLIAAGVNAQETSATTSKPFMFSIGVEGALPIGDFGDIYSFGIGGSLQGEYKVANDLGITLNAGYLNYSIKSDFGSGSIGLVPVLAGIKYYFTPQVYGHGQLGAAFSTETGGGTNFTYSPGIGYMFTKNIDAELKYTGISVKDGGSGSSSLNSLGLRVAYNF